jgi:anti-sigma factor RsiW
MHEIVMEEFERHLNGKGSQAFHDHLDSCPGCRAEVAAMTGLSTLLREMHADSDEGAALPPLGFYNRLTDRIVEEQRKSFWGLFSPDAAFFRRVAFASLLLLAGMGSFLISRESSQGGTDAAAIMAQHDVTSVHAESADRDRLLVTLATYRQ